MPTVQKLTAVDDVIKALVAALKLAVTYQVSDGPVTTRPSRTATQLLVIGSEEPWNDEDGNPTNSAMMQQTFSGVMGSGARVREETLEIPCVAIGHSSTVALARGLALNAVSDAFNYLNPHPTDATYNALVADIGSVESRNQAGGAVVTVKFTISASARLI